MFGLPPNEHAHKIVGAAQRGAAKNELLGRDRPLHGATMLQVLNNTLDRTLYGGRMIAYAAVHQLTAMLGFALGRNAIAAYLHRQRHPGERAA